MQEKNTKDTPSRAEAIAAYCRNAGWAQPSLTADHVHFLAAGEYNENWLLPAAHLTPDIFSQDMAQPEDNGEGDIRHQPVQAALSGDIVFRINHGSQLGLADKQIAYEYRVLELLQNSGVTPRPYTVALPGQYSLHPITEQSETHDSPKTSGGILTMSHLSGGPLDYRRDTETAARIFAATHACPVPADHGLIVQADPVGDIVTECDGLLARFPDHPRTDIHTRLCAYRDTVARMGEEALPLFAAEPMVIANTEVNSGNFCIVPPKQAQEIAPATEPDNAERHTSGSRKAMPRLRVQARPSSGLQTEPQDRAAGVPVGGSAGGLVDWEKAVVTCRYQDLGHFLVPTTTLWKTDYTYTAEGRRQFITAYREALVQELKQRDTAALPTAFAPQGNISCTPDTTATGNASPAGNTSPATGTPLANVRQKHRINTSIPDVDELLYKTDILERTILLRGLSWCYMAWYEYTRQDRALQNMDTFRVIERYLDEIEWFLR